jgi:hypothetical protein
VLQLGGRDRNDPTGVGIARLNDERERTEFRLTVRLCFFPMQLKKNSCHSRAAAYVPIIGGNHPSDIVD